MNVRFLGFLLLVWTLIFSLSETIYFGNNWTAQSPAEFICDSFAALFTVIGVVMMVLG